MDTCMRRHWISILIHVLIMTNLARLVRYFNVFFFMAVCSLIVQGKACGCRSNTYYWLAVLLTLSYCLFLCVLFLALASRVRELSIIWGRHLLRLSFSYIYETSQGAMFTHFFGMFSFHVLSRSSQSAEQSWYSRACNKNITVEHKRTF